MPSPVSINVELTEALTASICSHLAIEFFKHIAYQRQQLPFPYKQLMSVLKKRVEEQYTEGNMTNNGIKSRQLVQAEHEYSKVKGIFDSMQVTFENLKVELCSEKGQVEEIAMILGATPLSPRDVYRFQFPPLLFGHLDSKHPHQSSSLALIRCLISSEELHSFFNQPLLPTNMFLMLRKSSTHLVTSGFSPKERYSVPMSGKHAIIRLIPPTDLPKCICGGANVYRDNESQSESSSEKPSPTTDETTSLIWFQAQHAMKGFKDVKINGTSALTIWLQSR